jgi:anti-sigma B factor antagonist
MHFTLDKQEKYVVVRLHEEKLNTLIAAELKSELLLLNTQGYNHVIVDLSESMYCDSSGLSAILVGNRLSRNANGLFVLTGLNDAVLKLVQISHLDQVLNITNSLPDAIDVVTSGLADEELKSAVEKNVKNN